MSAVFKGRQSASLVSEEPVFDAATGVGEFDQTFAGSKSAIFAMAQQFEDDGISYRVTNNGPVYIITARVPYIDPTQSNPDRYEIFTEAQSLSLFNLPAIIQAAAVFDAALDDGEDTYRKVVEDSAESPQAINTSALTQDQADDMVELIAHLKAGVSGYEEDNLVLSRFRQIDNAYAIGTGQMTLRESAYVYTTAQLQLPSDIAFSLASLPTGALGLGRWGWRLRGQRVERVGSLTEQVMQLTYAAWSSLAYPDATGNLNW